MGWDINRFIRTKSIEAELICSICTDVVEDPVQTEFDHIFCRDCINEWLQKGNGTCPVERHVISQDSLKSPNRIIKQILNNLIIRCKSYGGGCCLMSRLEDIARLIEHEIDQCQLPKQ